MLKVHILNQIYSTKIGFTSDNNAIIWYKSNDKMSVKIPNWLTKDIGIHKRRDG